jgi:hypothetical protein
MLLYVNCQHIERWRRDQTPKERLVYDSCPFLLSPNETLSIKSLWVYLESLSKSSGWPSPASFFAATTTPGDIGAASFGITVEDRVSEFVEQLFKAIRPS